MDPVTALSALATAVDKAKRTKVALPLGFVIQSSGSTPASRLLEDRRGGMVSLRLYLTFVMQATRQPYELPHRQTSTLGRMLALDEQTAQRRAGGAVRRLRSAKLLDVREAPKGKKVVLLRPDGSGAEWVTPATQGRYISIPATMWRNGWILRLNARQLVVLLALIELAGGTKDDEGVVNPGNRKRQYGVSDDTWTRAVWELKELGFVRIQTERWGDELEPVRTRHRYFVNKAQFDAQPDWTLPLS